MYFWQIAKIIWDLGQLNRENALNSDSLLKLAIGQGFPYPFITIMIKINLIIEFNLDFLKNEARKLTDMAPYLQRGNN